MFRPFRACFAAALIAILPLAAHAASVTVFAAASLTDALQEIGKAYQAKTGQTVVFSFAASSVLAKQIEASGGADMFVSADTDWMDYLDSRGLIAHSTRENLLGNHLVLIAPSGSAATLAIAPHFDLLGALGGGRLSVADPELRAGRQIREDRSHDARRMERRRRPSGAGRERSRGARLRRER